MLCCSIRRWSRNRFPRTMASSASPASARATIARVSDIALFLLPSPTTRFREEVGRFTASTPSGRLTRSKPGPTGTPTGGGQILLEKSPDQDRRGNRAGQLTEENPESADGILFACSDSREHIGAKMGICSALSQSEQAGSENVDELIRGRSTR